MSALTLITRTGTAIKLGAIKNAPDILLVAGIACEAVGVYTACKSAAKNVDRILEEHTKRMSDIDLAEQYAREDGEEFTKTDKKHAKIEATMKTAIKFVKAFAIPVAFLLAGNGMIVASHFILKKRLAAAVATSSALLGIIASIRERVVKDQGESKWQEYRYGRKAATIVDGGTGVMHEEVIEQGENDIFSDFFDDRSDDYVDPAHVWAMCEYSNRNDLDSTKAKAKACELNLRFLRDQERLLNLRLKNKGVIFINEARQLMHLPLTREGQRYGWVWKNDGGDHQIDFGLNSKDQATRMFIQGIEPVYLIKWNVDGDIMNDPKFSIFPKREASKAVTTATA